MPIVFLIKYKNGKIRMGKNQSNPQKNYFRDFISKFVLYLVTPILYTHSGLSLETTTKNRHFLSATYFRTCQKEKNVYFSKFEATRKALKGTVQEKWKGVLAET